MQVKDRLALVTGGSRGIGAAISLLLAEQGWEVLVNYRSDVAAARAVVSSIEQRGGQARAIQADVGAETEILRMFEQIPRLHGLVNNAGITGGFSPVQDLSAEVARRVLEVNVLGTMLCCREALRRMTAGAAIVNVSSIAARTGSPREYCHYAASKGAVESFTVGLAREVADRGIRVNCVAPGLVDTEIHAAGGRPGRVAEIGPRLPLGRAARAEEIARGVAWLLSPEASYATGTLLALNGGA